MTTDRWTRINDIFHQAIAKDREKRAAFLRDVCPGDDALRMEVEQLIAGHESAEAMLQTDFVRSAIVEVAREESIPLGQQFGPYRVVGEIGRGGMGRVFLGERADHEFHRRVAIKLIKRGMDSDAIVRHFRNEREILASLDHPNIAGLLDGGTSQDGLPFFVMEHIEGRPIDVFCQQESLSVVRRLQLFRKVCAAVSYAHQRLVIHRDIKPSNILVTAEGEPKLLDFGIARLLRSQETSETAANFTALPLMTPEYASPEQVQGLAANTLTDVYSLGVVLYRLLTGTTPNAQRSARDTADKNPGAEPMPPSEALAQVLASLPDGAHEALSKLAETSIERARKRLEGDLDNIVLMAIRPEPDRRYQSVEQFSDDIRRHLEMLPVLARQESMGYRMARFARRHRAAVTASAAAVLALAVGTITTTIAAHRARVQEQMAKQSQARAERRFNEVRELARTVLFDYHDSIKNLPGSTPVRERLVRDSLKYLDGLAQEAGDDRILLKELASAYERVADVQGGSLEANLGNTPAAIESGKKALDIRSKLLASNPQDSEVKQALGNSYLKVGGLLWETGDTVTASEYFRQSVRFREELAASNPAIDVKVALATSYDRLGMLLQEQGDLAAALAIHQKSLQIYNSVPAPEREKESIRRSISVEYEHIGADLMQMNDLPAALENNSRALSLRAALTKDFPLNSDHTRILLVSYYNQGEILARMNRDQDALASYRQDVGIARTRLRADPANEQNRDDLAYGLIRVGDMFFRLNRYADALDNYRQSRELRAADVKSDPTNLWKRSSLIEANAKLCKTLASLHQREQSSEACATTLSLMQATSVSPDNSNIRSFFADTYIDIGDANTILAGIPSLSRNERQRFWQVANKLYGESLAIWRDLKARNILVAADRDKESKVLASIAKCEAALRL